ncbi:MAG TPA: ERF family protein [Candidatus Paceibacterota bacterium]
MITEHSTPELFAALSKAQAEIENASKNANNPHFRSKYADLAEVLTTIRDTFPRHGLSLIQSPSFDGAMCHVTTLVAHDKGGYLLSQASCVPAKSDAQGIGAATTYLRRYGASAMAGIAQEDDDGQSAAHNRKPAAVSTGKPQDGAWEQSEALGYDRATLEGIGATANEYWETGDVAGAVEFLDSKQLPQEAKIAVWTLFDSKFRAAIKKHNEVK